MHKRRTKKGHANNKKKVTLAGNNKSGWQFARVWSETSSDHNEMHKKRSHDRADCFAWVPRRCYAILFPLVRKHFPSKLTNVHSALLHLVKRSVRRANGSSAILSSLRGLSYLQGETQLMHTVQWQRKTMQIWEVQVFLCKPAGVKQCSAHWSMKASLPRSQFNKRP